MIPIVDKIYNLGTQEIKEDYKIPIVRISNIMALLFLMAGVIYGAISAYLAPHLINVCVLLFIGSAFCLLLNYLQFVDLSRFLLNLLISLVFAVYHGFIVQAGEPLIISIYIGQFVVAILPWIYIGMQEKWLLGSSLAITFLFFVLQPWTNEFLNIEMESSIFRENIFTIPTYTFAIAGLIFCMYLLQNKNIIVQNNSKKLLADIQARNKEMEKQQEKLVKTLEENKLADEAEEKRNWIAKGVSEIGNLLRGEINDKFYQHLVAALVNFMNINQAGFYTVEEDKGDEEKYIALKSCYAFDRNKFLTKKIKIGQGLIGQCYLEKEHIYLKEVPESYFSITSGLGDATPKCILISPLIYNGSVQGIIEIASFHELEQHEIDFIDTLSETLASFIASNKINLTTKNLLEQSQQQEEELRSQEEEMKQNMEEMQATQEELSRNKDELESQKNDLMMEIQDLKKQLGN